MGISWSTLLSLEYCQTIKALVSSLLIFQIGTTTIDLKMFKLQTVNWLCYWLWWCSRLFAVSLNAIILPQSLPKILWEFLEIITQSNRHIVKQWMTVSNLIRVVWCALIHWDILGAYFWWRNCMFEPQLEMLKTNKLM